MSDSAHARWRRHATPQEIADMKRMDANLARIYGELRRQSKERAILWNRVTKRRAYREATRNE